MFAIVKKVINSSATVYSLSQVGLGLLNYIFQLLLISKLNPLEYGQFLSWYSFVGLFLVLGSVFQNYSNFELHDSYRLKKVSLLSLFFVIFIFTIVIFYPFDDSKILGFLYVVSSTLSGFLFGQLQGRFYFISLSILSLLSIVFRLVVTYSYSFLFNTNLGLVIISKIILQTHMLSLVITGLYVYFKSHHFDVKFIYQEKFLNNESGTKLFGSFILSLAAVLYPQLDFMSLLNSENKKILGDFAQYSVQIRSFYFLTMIVFQVLLPFQIHKNLDIRLFLSKKVYLFIYVFLGCIISYLVSVFALKMNPSLQQLSFLVLFCAVFNIFIYVYFYLNIQTFITFKKYKAASAILILSLTLPMVNYFYFNFEINTYLLYSVILNLLSLFFILLPMIKSNKVA